MILALSGFGSLAGLGPGFDSTSPQRSNSASAKSQTETLVNGKENANTDKLFSIFETIVLNDMLNKQTV
jgi:hypothetical protein